MNPSELPGIVMRTFMFGPGCKNYFAIGKNFVIKIFFFNVLVINFNNTL